MYRFTKIYTKSSLATWFCRWAKAFISRCHQNGPTEMLRVSTLALNWAFCKQCNLIIIIYLSAKEKEDKPEWSPHTKSCSKQYISACCTKLHCKEKWNVARDPSSYSMVSCMQWDAGSRMYNRDDIRAQRSPTSIGVAQLWKSREEQQKDQTDAYPSGRSSWLWAMVLAGYEVERHCGIQRQALQTVATATNQRTVFKCIQCWEDHCYVSLALRTPELIESCNVKCCHLKVIVLLEMYSKWNDYFNNLRPKNLCFGNSSEF